MTEFFFGAIGALAVVFIFGVGGAAGYLFHRRMESARRHSPAAEPLTDAQRIERQRLMDEQTAFHKLVNYSAEQAYGLNEDPAVRPTTREV